MYMLSAVRINSECCILHHRPHLATNNTVYAHLLTIKVIFVVRIFNCIFLICGNSIFSFGAVFAIDQNLCACWTKCIFSSSDAWRLKPFMVFCMLFMASVSRRIIWPRYCSIPIYCTFCWLTEWIVYAWHIVFVVRRRRRITISWCCLSRCAICCCTLQMSRFSVYAAWRMLW